MRFAAVAVLLVCASGCAPSINPGQPGAYVPPDLARYWGCDHAEIMRRAAEYRAQLAKGQTYRPAVGMDACELLARIGSPWDSNVQDSPGGQSARWWYRLDASTQLVTLRRQGAAWVVDYVDW